MTVFWLELEDQAQHVEYAAEAMKFLAAVEYEMHRAREGKDCYDCQTLRIASAVRAFIHQDGYFDLLAAQAIVRDDKQNLCPRHAAEAEETKIKLRG